MKGTSKYYCVFEPLGEGERKDYTADFIDELTDATGTVVDTIQSASWTYEPEDGNLVLENQAVLNGQQCITFARQPKGGTFYRLVCTAVTGTGRTYEKALGVPSQVIDGTK